MELSSVKTIKNLLKSRGFAPSKLLGQNFLVDRAAVKKIIEAAELSPEDTVLEIGPGLGVLTRELAKSAKRIIAVEKDPKMIEILEETLKNFKNVEIIRGDIRYLGCPTSPKIWGDVGHPDVSRKSDFLNFKIVGNLPFYLTAPAIRQFLEQKWSDVGFPPISLMVFMVQKEVAQRICSKPPDMNLLAVSVQFYAESKIISYISKKSFWPSPEVDAAIIKITPKTQNIQTPDVCMFFKIVKAGFSQPRKQLINNLSNGLKLDKVKAREWLSANNIQPTQRAETLTLEEWVRLTKGFISNNIETRP